MLLQEAKIYGIINQYDNKKSIAVSNIRQNGENHGR